MERFNANVGAADAALQERPEVLKAVRMDATVNVLHCMVYDLMRVFSSESFIRKQSVSVESRARLDVLFNFRL